MNTRELRSILAATDLDRGSDSIVESAARLAACTGADVHLVHVLELGDSRYSTGGTPRTGFQERVREAEQALCDQAERCIPPHVTVGSQRVMIYAPHKAILAVAAEANADLIVIGPHRGAEFGAKFLGTTADRVLRSSPVPCLVVRAPLPLSLRHIGVPTDFSDPSRGAIELALIVADAMTRRGPADSAGPEVRVMHAGWTVERVDNPSREDEAIRPQLERQVTKALEVLGDAAMPRVGTEVVWGYNPVATTTQWVLDREIDLLVLGTHGRGALQRALIGSMASSIARQAPCPVLLVPPTLWAGVESEHVTGTDIRLDRVLIGVDFSPASIEATRWVTSTFAQTACQILLHCVDVPRPPRFLRGRFGSYEELVRTAHAGAIQRLDELRQTLPAPHVRMEVRDRRPAEGILQAASEFEADIVVVGEHAKRPGVWNVLGDTAERVLHGGTTPVLVVQRVPPGVPSRILVAIDDSEATDQLLRWGFRLADRFSADLVAFHALDFFGLDYQAWIASPESLLDEKTRQRGAEWLKERLVRLELPTERATLELSIGDARYEISSAATRLSADLVIVGVRGEGTPYSHFLGAVSSAVMRTAPCPVLAVPASVRNRRQQEELSDSPSALEDAEQVAPV